jgi:hypothetical protein
MEGRFSYLVELWKQGVRFKEVVWLVGDRPLDPRIDGLLDQASTESEAAHIIWETAEIPAEMKALPVLFVAVPMDGKKRPTTKDTIIAYLQTNPERCTALFVSDQPFCGYQFAILQGTLPETIQFDVVGAGVTSTSHPAAAAIVLDTVARWLYQEDLNQRR